MTFLQLKIKSRNLLLITCSRVTPKDLSIPTCSPNTASLIEALYLLCRGTRTQHPNSRSPKDTASYWAKSAVYKSWKEARPGGGTFRSKESSLDCLWTEELLFIIRSLTTFLCAIKQYEMFVCFIKPGQQSEQTPGQFLNWFLQE